MQLFVSEVLKLVMNKGKVKERVCTSVCMRESKQANKQAPEGQAEHELKEWHMPIMSIAPYLPMHDFIQITRGRTI